MNIEGIDWEDIYPQLLAFTHYRIKNIKWYRGASNLPKGYTEKDLVYETIAKYLENPNKFNSSKGNFITYLKYNILRQLISNLGKSSENAKNVDVETYQEQILSKVIGINIINEIDIGIIINEVENNIEDDSILFGIFYHKYYEGYERAEVCEELKISTREYDNNMRRLRRIVEKILNKFNYEQPRKK